MAKIITLLKYRKISSLPLTPLMIKALRTAFKKQNDHEPFGQVDLRGSFTALLNREFIDAKIITVHGRKEVLWYVTISGIKSLNKLGFNQTC